VVADLTKYAGREQAYVKHYFLANYLERLVHKTASKFDEVVYVDGFSGPWQSSGESFEDTSFGIALSALRQARASWLGIGRKVRMSAHLVEKSAAAYSRLKEVSARYPDISITTYNSDFESAVPHLLTNIPPQAFMFLFVDPKGWRIRVDSVAPLFKRPNSEIVFNFMFDFINRAASMNDPVIVRGLDELIPHGNWRDRLKEISASQSDAPVLRKEVLIDAFSETLSQIGSYTYVAETPILRPLADRTLYSLIYATRKETGIEVFRDCQVKTLRTQSAVRGAAKVANSEADSGQIEIFASMGEMAPDPTEVFLQSELRLAESLLLELSPPAPASVAYGDIWPQVLAKHAIRKTELNAVAARLRKEGRLLFADWKERQRVPSDESLMFRTP